MKKIPKKRKNYLNEIKKKYNFYNAKYILKKI
jgi:hypothetical protein